MTIQEDKVITIYTLKLTKLIQILYILVVSMPLSQQPEAKIKEVILGPKFLTLVVNSVHMHTLINMLLLLTKKIQIKLFFPMMEVPFTHQIKEAQLKQEF